jgi:hypothetical protein
MILEPTPKLRQTRFTQRRSRFSARGRVGGFSPQSANKREAATVIRT